MGNNRQVILKIFRLDKNIYNELASEVSNFQIAIAIYISGFLFSGLAALNFLRNSLVYLEENLGLIVGTLPAQTVNELNNLISCLLYTSPSPRDLSTSRMPSSA